MKKKIPNDVIVKYHSSFDKITKTYNLDYNTFFSNKQDVAERNAIHDGGDGDTVYTYEVTFKLVKSGTIKTIVE